MIPQSGKTVDRLDQPASTDSSRRYNLTQNRSSGPLPSTDPDKLRGRLDWWSTCARIRHHFERVDYTTFTSWRDKSFEKYPRRVAIGMAQLECGNETQNGASVWLVSRKLKSYRGVSFRLTCRPIYKRCIVRVVNVVCVPMEMPVMVRRVCVVINHSAVARCLEPECAGIGN
jgi:hypothetical protein